MINATNTVVERKQTKKTRRGWIGHKIKQIYLRDDISCGFQICPQHGHSHTVFPHDHLCEDVIYFISTKTLRQQIDIICNCPDFKNLVILQSSLEALKKFDNIKYYRLKNYLESQQNSDCKIFILADVYHKQINRLEGRYQSFKHLINCMKWYQEHLKDIVKLQAPVCLLTINEQVQTDLIHTYPLIQFLKQYSPHLLDFIGFNFPQPENKQSNCFPEHLSVQEAAKNVKKGLLFDGKYMGEKSYFKIGKNMIKVELENNRAIFGDQVIIELKSIEQWGNKSKTISEEEGDGFSQIDEFQQEQKFKKLLTYLKEKPTILPKGKVVCVGKRNRKDFCGSINCLPQFQTTEEYQIVEFKPVDEKFPSFYMRTYNAEKLMGNRVMVSFDDWPSYSLYPRCHFTKIIGKMGDQTVEGDVILLEHNVEIKQFSKKVYQCLPTDGDNFKIPPEQEERRLDLRNLNVVSIDPPGCKDIDDALHCFKLPNGNLQIGVHIADVSYFVRPDTALDLEARNRCTTVYLTDRRTDMLPKLLTENLCSLKANVDRLAFSTIWEVDSEANIINSRYCKTIIRSRNAFTYQEAQDLINSESTSPIAQSIRFLNDIAKKLKQQRLMKGALTLASTQVKISMENETHSATDIQLYQSLETNYLIQQFMLLANISVAQKIYQRFPAISILRRHTPPKLSELEILKEILMNYQYQLDFQTSKALADSLNQIVRLEDAFFNKLIRILVTRCMNQATYFCSADHDSQEFYHYGLAAQFYTHFTSPIRRYADVLVHRLLCAAIDLEPLPNFMTNKIKMTKICEKMNLRNRKARNASRASSDYHIYQFFKSKEGVNEKGMITSINENFLKIMLIKYGLECSLNLSEEDSIKTVTMNKGTGVFLMCFVEGRERRLFDYVNVQVKVTMDGFHKKTSIYIID